MEGENERNGKNSKTREEEEANEKEQRDSFLAQEKAEEKKLAYIRDKFSSKLDLLSPVARAFVMFDIKRTKNPTIKEVDEIVLYHGGGKIHRDSRKISHR